MESTDESAIKVRVDIILHRRPDGGLRVQSEALPGLILSGLDQDAVAGDIGPAIKALLEHGGRWPEYIANDPAAMPDWALPLAWENERKADEIRRDAAERIARLRRAMGPPTRKAPPQR